MPLTAVFKAASNQEISRLVSDGGSLEVLERPGKERSCNTMRREINQCGSSNNDATCPITSTAIALRALTLETTDAIGRTVRGSMAE